MEYIGYLTILSSIRKDRICLEELIECHLSVSERESESIVVTGFLQGGYPECMEQIKECLDMDFF